MDLRPRARLVGTALVAGFVVGAVGTVVAAAVGVFGSLGTAGDSAFALGALAFGFGLLGWSGSILVGRSVEAMQERLDTASGWTERKSRRAMARVGGFGFGVMLGSSAVIAVT